MVKRSRAEIRRQEQLKKYSKGTKKKDKKDDSRRKKQVVGNISQWRNESIF